MSQHNRSLILGRPPDEEQAIRRDLDRQFFGDRDSAPEQDEPAQAVKISHRAAANEEADDELVPRAFRERASDDRRKGSRRISDYKPLDAVKQKNQGGARSVLMTIGAVVVTLVFGAAVWQAYSHGLRTNEDEAIAPLLTASGPFKVRPETEQDGADVAANASVFERMESPREPAKVEQAATPTSPTADVASSAAASQPAVDERPLPEPAPAAPPAAPSAKAESDAPAKPAPAVQAFAIAPGGAYAVQLAAASSEADALSEWERKRRLAPNLFAGAEKLIAKADVNGRIVYRVRVGYFATAADADGFCSAFKAKGGDCFRAVK